jgi:hypothetical protein
MAKRTMGVTRIWFHTRRKPDDVGNVAELPDGPDLLDAFESFSQRGITPDSLVRRETESYVRLQQQQRAGRAIVFEFESGRFGEEGKIRDVRTHQEIGEFTRDNATAVITHGVLLVPRSGHSALVFSERSSGQGGMPGLVDQFIEVFNARNPGHIMKKQAVVRTDAWLQRAQLTKVEGTVRKYRTDVATEQGEVVLGDLTHTFGPPRGSKYIPRVVLEGLRNRHINRAQFLGFAEGTELDEVDVTLSDGTQSKTFEIGNERTPNLNLVLTGSGAAAPTAAKVLNTALNEAADIFRHYGIDWSEADAIRRAISPPK